MTNIFKQITFSKKEFIVIMFFSLILIIGIGIKYVKDNHWFLEPTKVVYLSTGKSSYRININEADWHEIMLLPKIGETKAKAIVEYRNKYGNFKHVNELLKTDGIGVSILENIMDMVIVEGK